MFSIIRRITNLAGEYRPKLITSYILSIIEAFVKQIPIFMILYALIQIADGTLEVKDVWLMLCIIIASLVLGIILKYFKEVNQSACGYSMFARERMKIGDLIKKLPMAYFNENNIGNLTSVVTTDIKFIEETCMNTQLSTVVTSAVNLIATMVMLAFFSPVTSLIIVATCLLVAIIFNRLQKIAKENSDKVVDAQKDVIDGVIEYAKGMQVIKAFHLVGDKQQKTDALFAKLRDAQIGFEHKFIPPLKLADSMIAVSIGSIIYFAAGFVAGTASGLALALLLIIFSFEIYTPLSTLVSISADVRMTEASLRRYEEVLSQNTIADTNQIVELRNNDIEFKNVIFAYEEKPVIQNMSFVAKEKSMTALVGKSGCGKTTVCSLIARFWDVSDGQILLGGVDISKMPYEQLTSNISMVFQRVYLFNDTVYNNIAFGNANATKEQVIKAAKKARCYDFIMEMPDGFDTVIGEGGATLSGGEKQRISIARAILKDAPIILLDEATASVDPDNEHFIQEAISELIAEKTLIVIAHKFTTVMGAQQILVIEDGKISARGTHDMLLNQKGLYMDLWNKRERSRSWQIG